MATLLCKNKVFSIIQSFIFSFIFLPAPWGFFLRLFCGLWISVIFLGIWMWKYIFFLTSKCTLYTSRQDFLKVHHQQTEIWDSLIAQIRKDVMSPSEFWLTPPNDVIIAKIMDVSQAALTAARLESLWFKSNSRLFLLQDSQSPAVLQSISVLWNTDVSQETTYFL